ncbi:MAG: MnmC family methyltransferase [Scytonema sp. PMC 1069.18]|nr:MnmC family methyltransferase [Scytonema sp. PMC 1069.18]MEC4884282.1 MnmC family methyltransferase [Scytonema sp. PMC 1070.18]
MSDFKNFTPESTADGSFTFFSQEFRESFHSHYGARQESFLKFAVPTQLAELANNSCVRLLDVCYGLGYNTAAAIETIWAVNPNCFIEVIGLELNEDVPKAAIAHHLFENWGYEYTQILSKLAFEHQVLQDRIKATLLIGDARITLERIIQLGFLADAIFLDPFSPPQCPQLWTVEFIQKLALCLDVNGLLATYSCAAAVRTALLAAGLHIGSTPPVGRRSPGTVAAHPRVKRAGKEIAEMTSSSVSSCLPQLSQAEIEHLLTRAAIPYRDPKLCDPAEVILRRRQQEQLTSVLETTSSWRKRWLSKTL